MATEAKSTRYEDLDSWPSLEVVKALYEGQLAAAAAVGPALPEIAAAADAAADRLRKGGRLVYVGAGTSGRIGVQDGAELMPTFNWPNDRVVFIIAGGEGALLRAVENAEDSVADAAEQISKAGITAGDVVIGVAASGSTPFTVTAIAEATRRGAMTISVANNRDAPLFDVCTNPILVETGSEVIAGSTRMKAGTAQKIVLNLLSSLVMIRLGRVYRGLMVHMRATNAKLRRRAELMVAQITGCDERTAIQALAQAEGDVKIAALIVFGVDRPYAADILARNGDDLRHALADIAGRPAPARADAS
ncbi:N-acetylmuramic acid 6-phosphate etherase [Microvirga massiliensis]|uniref:N-acetylmuramic acid 6-phosphate etherase n=1 Tax=Microvirga massiliensis TaxID=1033741 RepID=UPI00062BB7B4|nr:N-acetylmuramic acid 6-phosphate etherase [Microvirga massiliensis]